MAINPEDLLIFKKRKGSGSIEKTEQNKPQSEKIQGKTQQPTEINEDKSLSVNNKSNITNSNQNIPNSIQNISKEKQINTVQNKLFFNKKQKVIKQSTSNPLPTTVPKSKTQEEVLSEKLFQNKGAEVDNQINNQLNTESNSLNLNKTREYIELEKNLFSEKDLIATEDSNFLSNEKNKEDINKTHSVKGLSCINHPWRSAYALCNYCHRPFCYADLSKNEGKNYCLEDIDQISKTQAVLVKKNNIYNYAASIFLFLIVVIFLYYSYQQLHYTTFNLFNKINSLGFINFIKTISFNYIYQLQNLLILLFSIIGGVLLLFKNEKTIIISVLILVILSMVLSYTYLISNTYYFLYSFISCIICMILIAIGKMSKIGNLHIAEVTEGIEWPRVETF
ncbi:MAG: hypothetical protein QXD23_01085 [Candidatus Micrarchaeaceae archaeon]